MIHFDDDTVSLSSLTPEISIALLVKRLLDVNSFEILHVSQLYANGGADMHNYGSPVTSRLRSSYVARSRHRRHERDILVDSLRRLAA